MNASIREGGVQLLQDPGDGRHMWIFAHWGRVLEYRQGTSKWKERPCTLWAGVEKADRCAVVYQEARYSYVEGFHICIGSQKVTGRTRATPQLFDTYCRSYVTLMSLARAPLYVASAWYGGIMLLRVRWGVILNTVGSSMTGALVTQLTDGRGGWLTFDTCYSEIESLTLSWALLTAFGARHTDIRVLEVMTKNQGTVIHRGEITIRDWCGCGYGKTLSLVSLFRVVSFSCTTRCLSICLSYPCS